MEDVQQIMAKLQTMSPEDSLPTWWTNKFVVASNSMNKMRDYIVNPLGEDKEDEPTVKKIIGKRRTHCNKRFVGKVGYTTKQVTQTIMKKNANVEGAEEITNHRMIFIN